MGDTVVLPYQSHFAISCMAAFAVLLLADAVLMRSAWSGKWIGVTDARRVAHNRWALGKLQCSRIGVDNISFCDTTRCI